MSGKKDGPKDEPKVFLIDPNTMDELSKEKEKEEGQSSDFLSSILSDLKKFESNSKKDENNHKIKMAFDIEPDKMRVGAAVGVGVYRNKVELLPDEILKRIAGPGGDDLVCQILQTRANHISNFGRPRDNRFDIGFDLLPKDKSKLPKDPEEMAKLMMRVEKVKEKIWKCGGPIRGEAETPTFSQYLKMITRDGLLYGRHASIMINNETDNSFWAFRAADAGTIYKTVKYRDQDNAYRKQALQKLKDIYQLTGRDFDEKAYLKGDYVYVQVIRGKPEQMFTADEMIVHNLYPTTNVEYNGYPLTPIDQVIHAVTTHIDITMSNKLWFQHGRAARGMIVVRARGVNDQILQTMRMQFQQTINSVRNAHRMPVFGIGPEDQIDWKPIDNSSRDMEFQYLSENNARVIMGAFQISPDELPGYGHLSKGSNSQSLAESNNEYKLEAARDVGIRPLLTGLQDAFNHSILPKIDEEIAQNWAMVFCGLDHDNPEKESVRLQQDSNIWMTMNDILDVVEKDRLPKEMGGDLPLSPQFWQTVTPHLTEGQIQEYFMKVPNASKDPRLNFYRDPLWMQWQQMQQQEVQMRVQMLMQGVQQQQMQAQQAALPDQSQQDPNQPQQEQPQQDPNQQFGKSEDFVKANAELDNLKKKYN